jgi:predicted Kef-type K+ transport protein
MMKKSIAVLLAILACAMITLIYVAIGMLLGWKGGGGMIPGLIYVAAIFFIWKKIMGLSKKKE